MCQYVASLFDFTRFGCWLAFFFFQAEDGIRDAQESRGLGDVYKRQAPGSGVPMLLSAWVRDRPRFAANSAVPRAASSAAATASAHAGPRSFPSTETRTSLKGIAASTMVLSPTSAPPSETIASMASLAARTATSWSGHDWSSRRRDAAPIAM